MRALKGGRTVEETEGRSQAQPSSGLPGDGNLSGDHASGPQQEEEMEGEVILEEDEELL